MSRYWIYDDQELAQAMLDRVSNNLRNIASLAGYTVVANTIVGTTEGEDNLRAEGTDRWSDLQRFVIEGDKLRWGFHDPYEIRPQWAAKLMNGVTGGVPYEPPPVDEEEAEPK